MAQIERTAAGLRILAAHLGTAGPLCAAAVHGEQALLASAGPDEIRLWDATTGEQLGRCQGDHFGVNHLTAGQLPDGRTVVVAATEEGVFRWDAFSGEPLHDVDRRGTGAYWVLWSVAMGSLPDGRVLLAGAGHDHKVYRLDAATGTPIGPPLTGHGDSVKAVAVYPRPAGTIVIASASDDDTIRRWDAVTGTPIGAPLTGHTATVSGLAAVPVRNGRVVLAATDFAGTLRRWDAETGEPLGPPVQAHPAAVMLATVQTADGAQLLTSGDDEVIRRWDAETGKLLDSSLTGIAVAAIALSNGSALIAVGATDGSITVQSIVGAVGP